MKLREKLMNCMLLAAIYIAGFGTMIAVHELMEELVKWIR